MASLMCNDSEGGRGGGGGGGRGRVFVIEGSISAGKSTLAEALATHVRDRLGFPSTAVLEELDPAALDVFYEHMELAPVFQNMVIENTLARLRKAFQLAHAGHVVFLDRGFTATRIFAMTLRNKIPAGMLSMHLGMIDKLASHMARPDLGIYLRTPAAICFQRMQNRGRQCEANVTPEYLTALEAMHDYMLGEGGGTYKPPEMPVMGYVVIEGSDGLTAAAVLEKIGECVQRFQKDHATQ